MSSVIHYTACGPYLIFTYPQQILTRSTYFAHRGISLNLATVHPADLTVALYPERRVTRYKGSATCYANEFLLTLTDCNDFLYDCKIFYDLCVICKILYMQLIF